MCGHLFDCGCHDRDWSIQVIFYPSFLVFDHHTINWKLNKNLNFINWKLNKKINLNSNLNERMSGKMQYRSNISL